MNISEKGKKRYEIIMQTGLELFLKKGYEHTSLSDIVAKAGGSLASIYKYFKDKEGLFTAIMDKYFDDFCKELDEKVNLKPSKDLEEILYNFGLLYFDIFCKPYAIALSRLIISECYKNKELGKRFSNNILDRTCKILSNYFQRDDVAPYIKEYDFEILSLKFCASIREPYHMNCMILGKDIEMTKAQKEKMIKETVDIFLHGIYK
ncbi:MAG: TetR/AcrR family transcriptional regulator [Campylobacter sp.]|nr:TetR/AcrR family transcriptional regulator [Campylobacter sp.]